MLIRGKLAYLLSRLDTIEKKSFWIVAPTVFLCGVVSLFTASSSEETGLVLIAAGVSVGFPLFMMVYCSLKRDYHFCYPTLCIGIGAICVPLAFLANGGFHSGMPVFCTAAAVICASCFEKKWRMLSFAVTMAMMLLMFYLARTGVGRTGAPDTDRVEMDIIFCCILASFGLFCLTNMILTEVRSYVKGAEVLESILDSDVRRQLIEQIDKDPLEEKGKNCRVTVLFVDISRFTSITEKMTPEDAAGYLNTFLVIADEAIHANGGVLDKFIGDCAMAYWPDPDETGDGVLDAVRTVFDIRNRLYECSEEIYRKFGSEMNFSAGMEYGDVVLGSIGSKNRREFTVIGDAVNTASRIQGIASPGELLISDRVLEVLPGCLDLSPIREKYYLRGKNKEMVLFHVNGFSECGHQKRKVSRSASRENANYVFHVCGCRGSFPVSGLRFSGFGGETSCYVLKRGTYGLVIDCGSGLANAKDILADCTKIDVLLTHVHYDHIMGLLDISVFPRGVPLTMYGNFSGWLGEDTVHRFLDSPYWPVNLEGVSQVDIELGKEYELSEKIRATFFRSDHPNNGTVIRLRAGNQKVCILADMETPEGLDPSVAYQADLMLYDGMYDDEDRLLHEGWGHSTWQEAARYAKAEDVKRLVVTHHNPVNGDHALMEREARAKEMFEQTIFARTGDRYLLQ